MMHRAAGACESRANASMVGAWFTLLVLSLGGLVSILFMALSPVMVGFVSDTFFPQPEPLIQAIVVHCFIAGLMLLRFGSATLGGTIAAAQTR